MSGARFPDLTGRWLGRFDYSMGHPPVPFEADLHEAAGLISGQTEEPNSFRPGQGPVLQAMIEGHRDAAGLSFVKRYLGFSQGEDPVYQGAVDMALIRISGRWYFEGEPGWTGRFVMMRKPMAADRAQRRARLDVPERAPS